MVYGGHWTGGNWPPFSATVNFLSCLVGACSVFQMVGFEFRRLPATCGNVLPLTSDPPIPPISLARRLISHNAPAAQLFRIEIDAKLELVDQPTAIPTPDAALRHFFFPRISWWCRGKNGSQPVKNQKQTPVKNPDLKQAVGWLKRVRCCHQVFFLLMN